ncbi:MAG: hydrogenase maturation protease [Actinomycetota bacterium]|nr:hydrogenase maturation protease [Actinomycetota bacterium]
MLSAEDIKIIGFGNKYRSDDGLGIRVIEEIKGLDSFKDIDVIDGGTSGIDLLFLAKTCKKIIIVDALDVGIDTDDVICIKVNDIEEFIKKDCKSLSLHDLNLSDILKLIKTLKIDVEIIIIGIKPVNIDFGENLSPEIERKIPQIISMIKEEIQI